MFAYEPQHEMARDMVRAWCESKLLPAIPAMERGELLPYDLMREMSNTFGLGAMVQMQVEKKIERLKAGKVDKDEGPARDDPLLAYVVVKELSRVSPGFAMGFGVTVGLAAQAILRKGTAEQVERWASDALTLKKISSWCLTEPGAGSDAFGSMRSTAKWDGTQWVINGQKTFITNGPFADLFVVYVRLDDGTPVPEGEKVPVGTFVLERGMPGLTTSKPMHKMGMKDSPTGEVFMDNVKVGDEYLLGGRKASTRASAKESLGDERSGLPAMALGIIERCYELSLKYAKERKQFGKPIAEFQAVQLKLSKMYIHLKNVENIMLRTAWMAKTGVRDMAYICATKAYVSQASVEVALDAIQLHGGYGYMEEYHIEKLMRDAKLLEIGAGTTDINLLTAAKLELERA